MNTYPFDKSLLPVSGHADVLVAGGGTAGAVAAISAAREGADTLIIEQYGALGGSQTMALVTPIMHSHILGNPQSSQIAEEIRSRLGESAVEGYFDMTALKCVLEDLAMESGARILYHTTLVGVIKDSARITHAVVFNADGLSLIEAKVFIDATADGTLSVLSGASYHSGNERGFNQAVSLRFVMEGVDTDAFAAFNESVGETDQRRYPLLHAASVKGNPRWHLNPMFYKAYEDGLLTLQDIKYFQCFTLPGRRNALAFNCPELGTNKNVLDPAFATDRQIEGKRAIRRIAHFLIERMPGFQCAYVSEIAPMLGVRESRRVECEYMLTAKDITNYAKFPDFIATSNYPIDIHDAGDDELHYKAAPEGERYYEIPMRSLVVKGLCNLFIAGRAAGADFVAQSSIRVQHTCRAMGEAAGIAAALCAQGENEARSINGTDVRTIMQQRGAQFI